jgi:hypothetical protein
MNTQKYIIRCDRAGVFYGEIVERRGSEIDLKNARRIHYWSGAASLSQIAIDGVGHGSRLTMPVDLTVLGVIEVIPVHPDAQAKLDKWPVWKL